MELQTLFEKQEEEIQLNQSSSYQDTTKIPLDALSFQHRVSRSNLYTNIERLKKIFTKTQCQQLNPTNRIPAMVSQHSLNRALQLSNITLDQLLSAIHSKESPLLKFRANVWVECLNGESRIAAAEKVLPEHDT